MSEDKNKIAKIETIVNMHTEEIKDLRASVKQINNHMSEMKTDLSSLTTKVDDMDKAHKESIKNLKESFENSIKNLKEDIKSSNNRNLWLIGVVLTITNIIIGVALHFI